MTLRTLSFSPYEMRTKNREIAPSISVPALLLGSCLIFRVRNRTDFAWNWIKSATLFVEAKRERCSAARGGCSAPENCVRPRHCRERCGPRRRRDRSLPPRHMGPVSLGPASTPPTLRPPHVPPWSSVPSVYSRLSLRSPHVATCLGSPRRHTRLCRAIDHDAAVRCGSPLAHGPINVSSRRCTRRTYRPRSDAAMPNAGQFLQSSVGPKRTIIPSPNHNCSSRTSEDNRLLIHHPIACPCCP
jgi:hypothetical protein